MTPPRTWGEYFAAEAQREDAIFRAACAAGVERRRAYALALKLAARPLPSEQGARLLVAAMRRRDQAEAAGR